MKLSLRVMLIALMTFLMSDLCLAFSKRVNQLPNGATFGCANCHLNPNGGGARNPFGQAVANGFLDNNGDVTWNSSLAGLDSDSDGVTNGAELQDAQGFWTIGQSQPGDVNLVSNPGDAGSTTDVVALEYSTLPDEFNLAQNYPNPFNPDTEIRFFLSKSSFVNLEIFNMRGQKIKTLISKSFSAGAFSANWDGTDDFGESVRSGVYMYRIQAEQFKDSKRMILMK